MRDALLAVALLASCSGGTPAAEKPEIQTGSGSGSDSEPEQKAVIVTDAATATEATGKAAAVTGKAGNAKLGAVVMLVDRTPVYCTPLESWPNEVNGKQVTAHGMLEQTDEFAASGGGAGTAGAVWVLRDCTYDPPPQ